MKQDKRHLEIDERSIASVCGEVKASNSTALGETAKVTVVGNVIMVIGINTVGLTAGHA